MRARTTTPLAVTSLPSLSRDGQELALVVAAAHFDWPKQRDDPPTLCERQPPPAMADVYHADPASSSLRWEGQSTYTRPGTDIYVTGHAWIPGGRPQPYTEVMVMVGPCERRAMVIGDRVWVRAGTELIPSRPVPFERMPLVYERSFGGMPAQPSASTLEFAQHNPVGRGLYERPEQAEGQPLPNIEDPQQLLRRCTDRARPVGFGPIARHWLPRRLFAGTYDQAWLDTRAPLWPPDMDERLFCAASPGLCAIPHLGGGELVVLSGLSPHGPLRFKLPAWRLQASFKFRRGVEHRPMLLDAIALDSDACTFTMIWRASLVANGELMNLLGTTVDVRARVESRW